MTLLNSIGANIPTPMIVMEALPGECPTPVAALSARPRMLASPGKYILEDFSFFTSPSGRNSSGKTLPFKSGDSGSDFRTPLADLIGAASEVEQWKVTSIRSKIRYTPEENALLVGLKGKQGLRWERIKDYFPARSIASLQVHYSTKLRPKDW